MSNPNTQLQPASYNSPSHHSSSQQHSNKHKKIRKDKKRRSTAFTITQTHQCPNIYEFIHAYGHQYFESSPSELLSHFQQQYKNQLHIKTVLSDDENVYKIKNHEICDEKAREYLELIKIMQNAKHAKVELKANKIRSIVHLYHSMGEKRHRVFLLSKSQSFLMRKRRQVLKEINDFLGKYKQQVKQKEQLQDFEKEILTLSKINKIEQNSLMAQIHHFLSFSKNPLQGIHLEPKSENITDQYVTALIRKNLSKAFDETPLDLLNYFKIIQNNEKNIYDDVKLQKLTNGTELKQYLKSKKHKSGRHLQHSLKTCCSACFSNHSQIFNPIQTCTECGMRMHLYCQKIQGKCQRCKYIRRTTEQKSQSHYCVICMRKNEKGVLIQSIFHNGKNENAHIFCLLIHQMWIISGSTLQQKMETQLPLSQCKYCQKPCSFYFNCKCCGHTVHGMCAYLAGCTFEMNQNTITVSCCNHPNDQTRLSFERKYKINFQNILYTKINELSRLRQPGSFWQTSGI